MIEFKSIEQIKSDLDNPVYLFFVVIYIIVEIYLIAGVYKNQKIINKWKK